MRLILLRHGNTFEDGQTAVWLGAKDDLPLTAKGHEQAKQVGLVLNSQKINAIYAGPLTRTKQTAEIVAQAVGYDAPIVIDQRLIELDYGKWSGLSDQEVKSKFGNAEIEAWTNHGIWPSQAGFSPSEASVKQDVKHFAAELQKRQKSTDMVLVVSSNGKLRYFLSLIPNEFENRLSAGKFKLGTGKAGIIDLDGSSAKLLGWNLNPAELAVIIGNANAR